MIRKRLSNVGASPRDTSPQGLASAAGRAYACDVEPAHAPPANVADDAMAPEHARRPLAALLRRLGPAGPMGLATLLLPPVGLALLIASFPWLRPYVRHGSAGLIVCVAAFALLSGLAVLPTAVLGFVAGYAFHFAGGMAVAMAGYAVASLIGYFLSDRIAGRHVAKLIADYPRWRAVHASLLGGTFGKVFTVVMLLRLGSLPPFAMTSYALGSTRVPLPPFVLGTLVGIIPRTAAMVSLAAGVAEFNEEGLRSADAPWLVALGAGGTILCTIVLTWWAKRSLDRMTDPTRSENAPVPQA